MASSAIETSPAAEAANTLRRDRERFLAAIIDSADDAIFAKALDATILSWNAGAQRMYGYDVSEIVGKTVHRLAPPERHAEIDAILARLARGERIEHFETERVRKNGERFPVSLAISPVFGANGKIVGASTVARDISEQRRLRDALQFQESLLTAESEASIDGILVVDRDGRVLFSNRRFAELWGLDAAVVADGREADVLAAILQQVADPEAVAARMQLFTVDSDVRARDEIRLLDGRVFDHYSAPVVGGKRTYGRVWYFRDITAETVRMAQLRAVIGAIDDAAIVFDPIGLVLLRNPAAERLLPTVSRYMDLVRLLDLDRVVDGESERSLVIDGATFQFQVSRRRIGRDGTTGSEAPGASIGWLVLLRNVTELRDAQASREAFVGVLSHELRTPITTVYAASKMLQRRQGVATRMDLLHDIEAESDRLYRLVEDLLVLTRIERDNLEILDQPILMGPLVRRIAIAERARNPDTTLDVEVADKLPMAAGEETYVEQIVRNLVSNAVKYGPPGGFVRVVVEPGGRGVRVRVADDGPGIAAGESERVFDLLYRSPATAAQASGSGIGLFVSRRLAAAMGGDITAQTRPEGGSEFILELAAYDGEGAEADAD